MVPWAVVGEAEGVGKRIRSSHLPSASHDASQKRVVVRVLFCNAYPPVLPPEVQKFVIVGCCSHFDCLLFCHRVSDQRHTECTITRTITSLPHTGNDRLARQDLGEAGVGCSYRNIYILLIFQCFIFVHCLFFCFLLFSLSYSRFACVL